MNPLGLALLAYLGALFALVFVLPSVRVRRATGVDPVVIPRDDSAPGLVGRLFRLTLAAVAATVVVYALWPAGHELLAPIRWLERPWLAAAGVALLAAALAWIVVAQVQMGRSWRIGFDPGERTKLVSAGLFALSRNPIFLGMRAALLGFLLVLPSAATLALLALGEALIQVQVRLEEDHLERQHGEAYRAYRERTPRWLGPAPALARDPRAASR